MAREGQTSVHLPRPRTVCSRLCSLFRIKGSCFSCQLLMRTSVPQTPELVLCPASSGERVGSMRHADACAPCMQGAPHGFTAKVADFGLSREMHSKSRVETRTYGTITHMPPELLSSDVVSKARAWKRQGGRV